MSQYRLDEADVRAVLQHVRGHRMPEQVARPFDLDAGLADVAFDAPTQRTASKGGTVICIAWL